MTHPLQSLIAETSIDEVVKDCVTLVHQEVSSKRGLSGTMIKGGLKVIERIRPRILEDLFYSLLPNFVEQLIPLYDRFQQQAVTANDDFSVYLKQHADEVASALLMVTDQRAKTSKLKAIVKIYQKLRPIAQDQINAAIPALTRLLAKHHIK